VVSWCIIQIRHHLIVSGITSFVVVKIAFGLLLINRNFSGSLKLADGLDFFMFMALLILRSFKINPAALIERFGNLSNNLNYPEQ